MVPPSLLILFMFYRHALLDGLDDAERDLSPCPVDDAPGPSRGVHAGEDA